MRSSPLQWDNRLSQSILWTSQCQTVFSCPISKVSHNKSVFHSGYEDNILSFFGQRSSSKELLNEDAQAHYHLWLLQRNLSNPVLILLIYKPIHFIWKLIHFIRLGNNEWPSCALQDLYKWYSKWATEQFPQGFGHSDKMLQYTQEQNGIQKPTSQIKHFQNLQYGFQNHKETNTSRKHGILSSCRKWVSFYFNTDFFHLQEKEESEQAERNGGSPPVYLNNDAFLSQMHKARIMRSSLVISEYKYLSIWTLASESPPCCRLCATLSRISRTLFKPDFTILSPTDKKGSVLEETAYYL